FTDHSLLGFADASGILLNKLLKFTLSDVHHAICVSHTSKENTVLRAALDPQQVSVIPNAIIAEQFEPDLVGARDPSWITVVVLSRLVYRKGIDLLVVAVPRICQLYPRVRFVIGGDGPKRIDLEQMRERFMLQDRVELLGSVKAADVRSVLVRGDIFLNTSLTEAFCIAIVEAAACGLLVVSTKVGGIPEVLPRYMITFALPEEDDIVEALSQAIAGVDDRANHPELSAQRFHSQVKKMYSWHNVAERTERVYRQIIDIEEPPLIERFRRYYGCGLVAGKIFCLVAAIDFLIGALLAWLWPKESIELAQPFASAKYQRIMAMVATRSHVFRLTWAGVVVSTTLARDIHDSPLHTGGLQHNPSDSIVHDSPPAAQVRQMLRVPVRGAAAWAELFLFSDGTVHVLSGDGSAHVLPGAAFTVLAYSAASGVVAAGTAGSEVLLYALGGGEGPAPALLAQWALGHDRTARVTALAWAPDGAALACGYSTGHVVLRTALGLELNATRLGSSAKQAAAVAQPRLLHWAPGATRLYVLSDCVAAGGARCGQQGDVLPLARAAGGEGGARRVCLYADDKVLLHHGDFYGQQQQPQQQQRGDPGADLPPPELLWHVAHVPPAYIGANWPLRHVAADADGQHVAVAGRRGVACYSVAAQRWRLLRNRQQEAALA
ncbi:Phosphatidylinositol N-acetylglucosaminyltransferase GPI3 subunit, partial [Coemansia sp. RSA 2052]